jgi:hypothetical protein
MHFFSCLLRRATLAACFSVSLLAALPAAAQTAAGPAAPTPALAPAPALRTLPSIQAPVATGANP